MSVYAKITPKQLFKKKINIEDIINLTHLSYGVYDAYYRLIPSQVDEQTLIYDSSKLARGIELSIEKGSIVLALSLPTSPSEIKTFYQAIEKICHHYKLKEYLREGEKVNIKDNAKFIKSDEETSIASLKQMRANINQNNYERFELFGVCNPISIGNQEISQISNDLTNFEDYLNHLQSQDVFYVNPHVYQLKNKRVGIYIIGTNIPSVIPTKPYIILNQIEDIDEWYAMLSNQKTVSYDDFINNVTTKEYYDNNHVIVTLSHDEVEKLIDKYHTTIK